MSDELGVLGKETEKVRKATKDLGTRLERGLQEQENMVDKVRLFLCVILLPLRKLMLLSAGSRPFRLRRRRTRATPHAQARRNLRSLVSSPLLQLVIHHAERSLVRQSHVEAQGSEEPGSGREGGGGGAEPDGPEQRRLPSAGYGCASGEAGVLQPSASEDLAGASSPSHLFSSPPSSY